MKWLVRIDSDWGDQADSSIYFDVEAQYPAGAIRRAMGLTHGCLTRKWWARITSVTVEPIAPTLRKVAS